jgi:MFS family permease
VRANGEAAFDPKLIAPLVLGAILNPVNSSIIAVSLVPIGRALGAPASQTAWLVSALYLATAIGQPVVGRLIDVYGPRRLFLVSAVLVGAAGIVGTVASSLGVLVAARVLLGFGTCAGYPTAMYLIRSEEERTGRGSPAGILTILAIATQTVAVVGPSLGGLLIGIGGWRSTFAVNIPLALAGVALALTRLPRAPAPRRSAGSRRTPALDGPGIALFAVALTTLLLFLEHPRGDAWYLPAISAVAAAGFALRELRAPQPFIDLRVLAGNAPLLATYGRTLLTALVTYSFVYGFTQWLEDGRGLSASGAGLILLPMFGVGIAVSAVTGRRPEVRGKLVVGGVAQAIACVLLLLLDARSPLWLLVLVALVVGLPQGLTSLANQNALYHQADAERIGSSAGLLRTFSYLGAIAASAAGGLFFGRSADAGGLHGLAVFMLAAALLSLLLTVVDRSLGRIGRPGSSPVQSSGSPEPEPQHPSPRSTP